MRKNQTDFVLITSQRGSTWHCYIDRLISKGKMRFSTSQPGKPMNILEQNLASVIMSVRSKNSPNLVQIGGEMVPPKNRFYIRAPESKLPLNVKIPQ